MDSKISSAPVFKVDWVFFISYTFIAGTLVLPPRSNQYLQGAFLAIPITRWGILNLAGQQSGGLIK